MTIGTDKLPQGWKWAALGEIILGKPQYGSVARKVPYNGKVRYVRITDLTDRGELKPDDPVSPSVIQPDRFLEPGDLLIARSGSVGRTYLHGNLPGTYQYAGYLIRFRIDPAKSLPGYVFYVSKSDLWREWIISNSKTSTLTNINAKQYSSFRLPLPPLCEQQRIAGILNQQMAYVEKARQAAEEILEAAQALPGAFLRQVFPALGDALPAGWKWANLGDVCNKIKTTDPKRNPDNQFIYVDISSIDRSVKRITTPSVRMGKDAPSRARRVIHKGDVLVATTRPNLNAVALVGDDLDGQICSTGLCVLRPDGCWLDSNYLYRYTTHEPFVTALTEMVNGSMYPAVTDKHVMGQQIPLPPLSEQKRIAALLNEQMAYVETVRMSAREQLDAINALPAALLRRAFAGGL